MGSKCCLGPPSQKKSCLAGFVGFFFRSVLKDSLFLDTAHLEDADCSLSGVLIHIRNYNLHPTASERRQPLAPAVYASQTSGFPRRRNFYSLFSITLSVCAPSAKRGPYFLLRLGLDATWWRLAAWRL